MPHVVNDAAELTVFMDLQAILPQVKHLEDLETSLKSRLKHVCL